MILILFLFLISNLTAKEIPKFTYLSGIEFKLENLTLLTQEANSFAFVNSKDKDNVHIKRFKNTEPIKISIPGNYKVFNEKGEMILKIRIIPAFLSILPPLLAILLALLIREVIVSLFAGILLGSFFIFDYDILSAFLHVADYYILNSLKDESHLQIILFTLLIGGVVGIISSNGGTLGIANLLRNLAKTKRSGKIASMLMGFAVFFDDYANTMLIGNMMKPITDKLKISREKLAFIVDSTAAPIASLVLISTWIGYELGLIEAGLNSINYEISAYQMFISTIPYRFYPIAALLIVFITSILNRDFGPMYIAEIKVNSTLQKDENENSFILKSNWKLGIIPIVVLVAVTLLGLYSTGKENLLINGVTQYGLQDIISNSNSYLALIWASLAASIVAILLNVFTGTNTLKETIKNWITGVQTMLYACLILTLAWSISIITNEIRTADYLISIIDTSFNPRFLPVIVFLISGFISFSTGTSWGTMAIVLPIIIPLSFNICVQNNFPPNEIHLILVGVISSVLAGSVWGDHCSPIADTTILSSISSECNHIDHVKTQLPYAITGAVFSMLLGDIPTAFGLNPYISIFIIALFLFLFFRYFGKSVN